jgi:hypothetical protein
MQLFTYFILIYATVNLYIRGGREILFVYTHFIFNTHIEYFRCCIEYCNKVIECFCDDIEYISVYIEYKTGLLNILRVY